MHDTNDIRRASQAITKKLKEFQKEKNNILFEQKLLSELKVFNSNFFPSPEFKYKVRQKEINEKQYGHQKAGEFIKIYYKLIDDYKIKLKQNKKDTFIDKWFLKVVRDEIDFVFNEIKSMKNQETKKMLALILSRTIRSCRATTHADLGTLKEPTVTTYYCKNMAKYVNLYFLF